MKFRNSSKFNILVPRILLKLAISMASFGFGLTTLVEADKIFAQRSVRTSFVQYIKETLATTIWAFYIFFMVMLNYTTLLLFAWVATTSYSWTHEDIPLTNYLFLLPFVTFPMVLIIQFFLFRHFIIPSSPDLYQYAFLSFIYPVRIYLIRDKDTAFNYYRLSLLTTALSIPVSYFLIGFALFMLPEELDTRISPDLNLWWVFHILLHHLSSIYDYAFYNFAADGLHSLVCHCWAKLWDPLYHARQPRLLGEIVFISFLLEETFWNDGLQRFLGV